MQNTVVEHEVEGQTYRLAGANADLWAVANSPSRSSTLGVHRDLLAKALASTQDNERVNASKTLIKAIWSQWPELGPYPFIDTLSEFEFKRAFYPQYRDHVCHQLKVYLLGLGAYDACPALRDGVSDILGDCPFEVTWAITAVFHDLGYIIESDEAQPGRPLWDKLKLEYEKSMRTPLSFCGGALTPVDEQSVKKRHYMAPLELGDTGDWGSSELFELFRDEAERAGLTAAHAKGASIKAYYEYAQKTDSTRPKFRDHGVASALLLLRHWQLLTHYVDHWCSQLSAIAMTHGQLDTSGIPTLQKKQSSLQYSIRRAAGAMSLHNITPDLWGGSLIDDAHSNGINFPNFRIRLGARAGRPSNGLAFLLGLVDTLQDWDRPTFGDAPKPEALHAHQLSIRPDPQKGQLRVFVEGDDKEFRSPETSTRSRYGSMTRILKSYLEPVDVDTVIVWDHDHENARRTEIPPSGTFDKSRFPKTWVVIDRYLETVREGPGDEQAARYLEQFMSAFEDSPIVDAAFDLAKQSLPGCHAINAIDVLGPQAWASPTAFRYLAIQLRYYARANVIDGDWNLEVRGSLGDAINRALENARAQGLEQSLTLFDNPDDFSWSVVKENPRLEYARVLLWSEEELTHPIATTVIDIHRTFHVPLFFIPVARNDSARALDFICFHREERGRSRSTGCSNVRINGKYELKILKNNGMIATSDGAKKTTSIFGNYLSNRELLFAEDARELLRIQRLRVAG